MSLWPGHRCHSPKFLNHGVRVALVIGVPACGHESDNSEEVHEELVGGLHFGLWDLVRFVCSIV